MMTVDQIIKLFRDRGFKVSTYYNRVADCYEITINKDNVFVGSTYKLQNPASGFDIVETYQHNFIKELLDRWEKERARYCREMCVKGLADGITNPDPEVKRYFKQALNSIYGKDSCKQIYILVRLALILN